MKALCAFALVGMLGFPVVVGGLGQSSQAVLGGAEQGDLQWDGDLNYASFDPAKIDEYLRQKRPDSPLIGLSENLDYYCQRDNVNPALVIGLAGHETIFATAADSSADYNNPFGYGWNPFKNDYITFDDFNDCYDFITGYIRTKYLDIGLTTIYDMSGKWKMGLIDNRYEGWTNGVETIVREIYRFCCPSAWEPSGDYWETVEYLIGNPNISFRAPAQYDLEQGLIDIRVVQVLAYIVDQGYTLNNVGPLRSSHDYLTSSGNVSHHTYGCAVDICHVNGRAVSPGNKAAEEIVYILRDEVPLELKASQVGSPWAIGYTFFTNPGHQDHIHIGYAPTDPGAQLIPYDPYANR